MDLFTLTFAVATSAFAVYRLSRLKISAALPALFLFLCYQLLQNIVVLSLSRHSDSLAYQTIYIISEPLTWMIEILIIREIYNVVFRDYPGIASLARWNVYLAGGLAIALCIWVASSTSLSDLRIGTVLSYVTFWERCVMFTLALFIVILVVLLSRFPIRIETNLATNMVVFTVFFFANAGVLTLSVMDTPDLINIRYFGSAVIYALCFLAWGVLLKKPSETSTIRTRKDIDSFEHQRLLSQLAALNHLLVKVRPTIIP